MVLAQGAIGEGWRVSARIQYPVAGQPIGQAHCPQLARCGSSARTSRAAMRGGFSLTERRTRTNRTPRSATHFLSATWQEFE
jgi:hypothetical protein